MLAAGAGCEQRPVGADVLTIPASEAAARQVGRFDADSGVVVSIPGESGFLHYGPYAELETVPMSAAFALDARGDGILGRAEVNAFRAEQAERIVATVDILAGDGQVIELEFTPEAGYKYEFRVLTLGGGELRLREIDITRR